MLFSYLNEKPQRLVEHMDAAAPANETPAPANETPEEPVDEVVEQEPVNTQPIAPPQLDSQISLSEMRLKDEINRVISEVKMSRVFLIILVIFNSITFLLHLSKMMTRKISFPQRRLQS